MNHSSSSHTIYLMSTLGLSHDPKWQRADSLLQLNRLNGDVGIIGIPAHETSISKTSAHLTPAAIRSALARYSTYSGSRKVDLRDISMVDLGDVTEPDHFDGETRVANLVVDARDKFKLLIALGGDNSISFSTARGMWQDSSKFGIVTLDAHHDLRDGMSNGSPIWRLINSGVSGANIVQIGINDFANSREYTARARDEGIHVIYRSELRNRAIDDVMKEALDIAGSDGREIYVDIDVDVCDRSVVPACPAAMPGGISADELRQAVFIAGSDSRVRGLDIVEIDAALDSDDQRTVRLGALLVLEAACGVAGR